MEERTVRPGQILTGSIFSEPVRVETGAILRLGVRRGAEASVPFDPITLAPGEV